MSSYLREIKTARIEATRLTVELTDGSTFTVPLNFYPTLQLATDDERSAIEVRPYSLHWESLDCDLGIEGLLQGAKEHPKLAENARQRSQQSQRAARVNWQKVDAILARVPATQPVHEEQTCVVREEPPKE